MTASPIPPGPKACCSSCANRREEIKRLLKQRDAARKHSAQWSHAVSTWYLPAWDALQRIAREHLAGQDAKKLALDAIAKIERPVKEPSA